MRWEWISPDQFVGIRAGSRPHTVAVEKRVQLHFYRSESVLMNGVVCAESIVGLRHTQVLPRTGRTYGRIENSCIGLRPRRKCGAVRTVETETEFMPITAQQEKRDTPQDNGKPKETDTRETEERETETDRHESTRNATERRVQRPISISVLVDRINSTLQQEN